MKDNTLHLIEMGLAEDIGTGDVTSSALIDPSRHAVGRISAKQSLVLAGIDVARRVFELLDSTVVWDQKRKDGERCEVGDIIAIVQGPAHVVLKGERTALNFLQRFSGIATLTAKYVDAVRDTNAKILDTRKTIPAYRILDKHAVKMGGGNNHRMGLYDHILIKNNHLAATGSVSAALELAHKARKPGELIEIEVKLPEEAESAAQKGVDMIMLDNMTVENVKRAVKLIRGRAKIEVSGNITLDNIHSFASTGVDYISIGAITHSVPAADIHMLTMIERKPGEHSLSSMSSAGSSEKK